jgi:ankyrin repeat protein
MEEQKAVEVAVEAAELEAAERDTSARVLVRRVYRVRKANKADAVDKDGKTLLYHAADRGNVDEVEEQLKRGADVNKASNTSG